MTTKRQLIALKRPVVGALVVCSALTLGASALDLSLIGRFGYAPQNLDDEDPTNDVDYFDGSAAEIPAYDPVSQRVFVTNSVTGSIDVISIADPEAPTLEFSILVSDDPEVEGDAFEGYAGPTSVVFTGGVLAVSVVANPETDPGLVAFFDADGNEAAPPVTVGVLPDAITASPDGNWLVTSNEGQPSGDNTIDPEGSVSVIDISGGVASASVATGTFESFNTEEAALRAAGVRIFGLLFIDVSEEGDEEPVYEVAPTTVAQDLEPEYATIGPDNTTAYVTLQENNAIAVVDLASATVTSIVPLGLKDHSVEGNGLDPSNRDGRVGKIRTHEVLGMYQPDAIASYEVDGKVYLVTANEGDSRDYDNFSEEIRGNDLTDAGFSFLGQAGHLKNDKKLGRLKTTIAPPETAIIGISNSGDPVLDKVVAYGARSFSIWCASTGELVFDSGDQFEQITLADAPDIFNATNDDPEADDRSDDKGPEPEGVVVAEFAGATYAFVTLERIGGVMAYDISDPANASFAAYMNSRRHADDPAASTVEDNLGPESLVFIAPEDSPNGEALLVVTNEVSGSTLIYAVSE